MFASNIVKKVPLFFLFQKKEDATKEKASIEDSAFEALEKDFQDVRYYMLFFF